jgi:hypothetical protein
VRLAPLEKQPTDPAAAGRKPGYLWDRTRTDFFWLRNGILPETIHPPAARRTKNRAIKQGLYHSPSGLNMNSRTRLLSFVGLAILTQSLSAQQQGSSTSPQVAWSDIRQLVQNLETAVQSKNLHGIHEPSMKIRAPIRTLKQHSSMLSSDASKNMVAALKQLDSAVTDLHSAADAGDQKEAESALKAVQTALDELKALDPETAFK